MVPKFADYWREQTGHYPARLLFDSRATTYAGLNELNRRKIDVTDRSQRESSRCFLLKRRARPQDHGNRRENPKKPSGSGPRAEKRAHKTAQPAQFLPR